MTGESFYRPSATLDALTSEPLPGGCEDCTSFQTIRRNAPGVYILTIHHDPTCPTLASKNGAHHE